LEIGDQRRSSLPLTNGKSAGRFPLRRAHAEPEGVKRRQAEQRDRGADERPADQDDRKRIPKSSSVSGGKASTAASPVGGAGRARRALASITASPRRDHLFNRCRVVEIVAKETVTSMSSERRSNEHRGGDDKSRHALVC
jgi:hypothetical protein